ncbi:uncharacterized protein PHACADRAFT_116167 [Phanerochaete carnosa HHB-10118-sp]|uniref:Protein kinase domain-containing protein n=1 Tax=Phanerochaete carnosa (strain HHB-10118-sp) TaxID=650164 RepID=K5WEY5_PHACS|nr:uncharacterized protein PHACADRAFT_116167 [Phanerochaete carnosa HHB-10118-sp]EKM57815.1 hypothetical protein PHACADRAFT_116167 [Phanerochaete carnosa HHB-10118-sp]
MQETERRSRNIPTLPDQYVITSLECVWFPDKRIGSGGYASVYLGTYHGATVAVKVLRKGTPHRMMDAEVKIWMKLRHPHILPFYGCCSFADPPFMICEYKENGNINEYLRRKPEADRRKLLYEACLGLVHLHSHDIVHSDLKGSNILIDKAGTACLADFGLSKTKTHSVIYGVHNTSGPVLQGALRWMSPEQIQGASPDKPGDVYSFAMTIYEIFTSSPPFSGVADSDVQHNVCSYNTRPLRPIDPRIAGLGLDDTMWALVTRCWDKEARARPFAVQVLEKLKVLARSYNESHRQQYAERVEPVLSTSQYPAYTHKTGCLSPPGEFFGDDDIRATTFPRPPSPYQNTQSSPMYPSAAPATRSVLHKSPKRAQRIAKECPPPAYESQPEEDRALRAKLVKFHSPSI